MRRYIRSLYRRALNWTIRTAFNDEPLRRVWARSLLMRTGSVSYPLKLLHDAVPRPCYGIPIYYSLQLAKRLGYDRVSIIEFGVAGGNGLLNIEYHVKECQKYIDIAVDIYGFDLGSSGLPKPIDYRDLPYQWQEGFYKMDVPKLQSRLTSAKLVLGDVKKSLSSFSCAPVACVMIDLDYYSSTVDALEIFNKPHLPRVFCYFDDVTGNEICLYNEFTGELLAINEYNANNADRKIAKARWVGRSKGYGDNLFVFHDFKHPKYGTYVNSEDGTGCDLVA